MTVSQAFDAGFQNVLCSIAVSHVSFRGAHARFAPISQLSRIRFIAATRPVHNRCTAVRVRFQDHFVLGSQPFKAVRVSLTTVARPFHVDFTPVLVEFHSVQRRFSLRYTDFTPMHVRYSYRFSMVFFLGEILRLTMGTHVVLAVSPGCRARCCVLLTAYGLQLRRPLPVFHNRSAHQGPVIP